MQYIELSKTVTVMYHYNASPYISYITNHLPKQLEYGH